jgi:hypothetical protein
MMLQALERQAAAATAAAAASRGADAEPADDVQVGGGQAGGLVWRSRITGLTSAAGPLQMAEADAAALQAARPGSLQVKQYLQVRSGSSGPTGGMPECCLAQLAGPGLASEGVLPAAELRRRLPAGVPAGPQLPR